MKIDNRHEEGSELYELREAGEELARQHVTDNPIADALDRLTVVLYRIGVAVASRMDDHAVYNLGEEVQGMKYALSEIAEALKPPAKE